MLTFCDVPVSAIDDFACSGDLLLYRDKASLQDELISRSGRSLYCHAGMLARKDSRWIVLEMVEWRGGRWRYLDEAVREDAGWWDVYNANAGGRWTDFDRRVAIRNMWHFVNKPYGWRNTLWDGVLKMPVIRALVPVDVDDTEVDRRNPNCSEGVSISHRLAGVDPVPNLPDALTEPGDLARSLFYEYAVTIRRECPGED